MPIRRLFVVQRDAYLLEVGRYIVLNPLRAGMVMRVEDWPWSSYRATVGVVESPAYLSTDWLLSALGSERRAAIAVYSHFVAAGIWTNLRNQIFLGSEDYVQQMQEKIRPEQPLREVPSVHKRPVAKALSYFSKRYPGRDEAMAEAYKSGAYSMQEIGTYFGVGRMTVSRAVKKSELTQ